MAKFTVKTGFGYFKDSDGDIVAKSKLPLGEHPLKDDFTYTEVESQVVFNAIIVVQEPLTGEELRKQKIWAEVFRLAEQSLIDKGEIEA